MENNDRQQDGGNLGEVREDVFVDSFDGEAVSEDAGQGDWGGLLNWDLPQEEQQGFVEGEYDAGSEYDPGFIPEGEYTPGSEYDPGFIPKDELYDEPVDASAADPWGSTQPPGYTGQAGADAGDGGIQMPPEYGGQAGTDIGDNEIEMPPMYAGRAGADVAGHEQNDDSVLLGAPTPESAEQAGAGDDEIEMPPMYAGRAGADTAVDENDIEMLPDDAGQVGADAGVDENDIEMLPEDGEIEMPPDYVGRVNIGYPREVSQDEAHEKELSQFNDYEDLAGYYKEIFNSLPDNYRIMGTLDDEFDPKSREALDTYEELKAATKRLLEQRDKQADVEQQLEARYGDQISGDPGLQTYDQLADYYKTLHRVLHDGDQDPDMTGLDTYERLKNATYELMRERDNYLQHHQGEQFTEEKDESHTDHSDDLSVIDSDKAALEGDLTLSGLGEHAWEAMGDVGEAFDDYFDSVW